MAARAGDFAAFFTQRIDGLSGQFKVCWQKATLAVGDLRVIAQVRVG